MPHWMKRTPFFIPVTIALLIRANSSPLRSTRCVPPSLSATADTTTDTPLRRRAFPPRHPVAASPRRLPAPHPLGAAVPPPPCPPAAAFLRRRASPPPRLSAAVSHRGRVS